MQANGWSNVELNSSLNQSALLAIYNNGSLSNATKNYIRSAVNAGDSVVLLNTTNVGNDTKNGSFVQRYNVGTGTVADDGKMMSDQEYTIIRKIVTGG